MFKIIMKCALTIIWNGFKLLRFNGIAFPFYIKKGLEVHNPSKIRIGSNVTIGRYGRLSCYGTSWDSILSIEDNVYIGQFFSAISGGRIRVGRNTLIASYVAIISENHGMNPECGLRYGLQPLIEKK